MPVSYTTSASSTATWTAWTSDTSSTSGNVWSAWSSGTFDSSITSGVSVEPIGDLQRPSPPPVLSTKEIERRKKHEEERAEAKKRARALLLEHLSPEQQEQFDKHQSFLVRGQSGKLYEIRPGVSGNVIELDEEGKAVRRYCAHPVNTHELPAEDVWLSQKLHLEHNEEAFIGIANKSQPYSVGRSIHFLEN